MTETLSIQEIKTSVRLSAVVGETLKLTKNGREFEACCPFHGEKTASFKVNDAKGFYHCFGCSSHGDVFDWLSHERGLNLADAIKYLTGESNDRPAPHINGKRPVIVTEPEDWISMEPMPSATQAPLGGFDVIHTYRNAIGQPIRYVGRKNEREGQRKLFIPITYGALDGTIGWHKRHPLTPRCLYGLDRLASMPDHPVLVCEGEKSADAAQKIFPTYACVTWSAGTANVAANDWSILAGRFVIIWPDNDEPGHKAAGTLRDILSPLAAHLDLLRVDDLAHAFDAADLLTDDPMLWLRDRLPHDEILQHPSEEPNHEHQPDVTAEGIIPLGHDRGVFRYYSRSATQIYELSPAAHTKNALTAMASVPHYWQRTQFVSQKGAILWDEAIDWLMRQCRDVGIYNPERLRGRGAWLDDGRAVLHLGDRLIVDGRTSPLLLSASKHIYEGAIPLSTRYATPLTSEESRKLLSICKALPWKNPISGTILAGFIAVAPVCGGLSWRPSIWMTGAAGSGKSWVEDNILAPAIGGIALRLNSKTSEAGIRQSLGSDARPVLFDEAESEDKEAAARIKSVLELMRASSSESGAKIAKGTQSQTGAKLYTIRSSFAFSSVNVSLEHRADESRVSVLTLATPDPREAEKSAAQFLLLNEEVQTTITEAFTAGLLSRSVGLLPATRANAECLAAAVALHFGSRRTGDQIGTLLAGAWSLHSDRRISPEVAMKWIKSLNWGDLIETAPTRDEVRLLSQLTQSRVQISQGNGPSLWLTVGRLMMGARGVDEQLARDTAERELRQIGIKVSVRDQEDGFWISNTHSWIRGALGGTPWAKGWGAALGRLPGGASSERASIRFAAGHISKAAWLPLTVLVGDGSDEEPEILGVGGEDIPF